MSLSTPWSMAYLALNSSKVSSWCSERRRAAALKLALGTKAARAVMATAGRATGARRTAEPRVAARKMEADIANGRERPACYVTFL